MGKYEKLADGDSFEFNMDEEYLNFACCSCGHVHEMFFEEVDKDTLKMTLGTDRKKTAALRRNSFGSLQIGDESKWKMVRKNVNNDK